MTEFIEAEIPGYGVTRYTREALATVTQRAKGYRVADLRRGAASRLAGRGADIGSAFSKLSRTRILVILAGLTTDDGIADVMECEAHFTVMCVTGGSYTLRADMTTLPPVTVTADLDGQGDILRLVTDTGAPVRGDARGRAAGAVRDYRIEHESALSASGPVDTSWGPSYSIIASLDGEEIEVGYVFTGGDGEYVDDHTIDPAGNRPPDDTRRAWYALADAHRTGAGTPSTTEPESEGRSDRG